MTKTLTGEKRTDVFKAGLHEPSYGTREGEKRVNLRGFVLGLMESGKLWRNMIV